MAWRTRKWRWTAGALILASLALLAAAALRPAPVENIETATVRRGDVVATLEVEGAVESSHNLEIKCQVAGGSTILWLVPDGSQVEAGDELVRFDSSSVEDLLSQQAIVVERARAAQIAAEHELAAARLALPEYVQGTFVALDEEAGAAITTAQYNLRLAEQMLDANRRLVRRGFAGPVQLEPSRFAVEQAKLQLDISCRAKAVLESYNRPKMTQDLKSRIDTAVAMVRSTTSEYELERRKLTRNHKQLECCVVRAPHRGLVIYANDASRSSDGVLQIDVGAVVRARQTVFWLPDLSAMQVRVLVHESSVLKVRPGMQAVVRVRGRELPATVSEVATQPVHMRSSQRHLKYFSVCARIAGTSPGLRPGETADLTLLLNYRPNVLRTPVDTLFKSDAGAYVWIEGQDGIEPRHIELGEVGDRMAEVRDGLDEGEHVVMHPRDSVPDADRLLLETQPDRRGKRFGSRLLNKTRGWLSLAR